MSGHTVGLKARGQSVAGPCGITVAYCGTAMLSGVDGSYSIGRDEAVANAVLFAAAPELLKALKACVVAHCPNDKIFCGACSPARAAIARAEGR